jgi:hypothetical protein
MGSLSGVSGNASEIDVQKIEKEFELILAEKRIVTTL